MQHPSAVARDKWFASADGEECTNGTTYGQYLRNRLERAFLAGWNAKASIMSKKYRKKPVIIEAVQFTGKNQDEITRFIDGATKCHTLRSGPEMVIGTLEGQHIASVGDFIIKGVKGEFYPCKPDIFAATYEAA